MQRCAALEEERDGLAAALARLQQQQQAGAGPSSSSQPQQPPASPGGAALRRDEELFELRLQRDQLAAQAKRLKERLADATAGNAAQGSDAGDGGVGSGTVTAHRRTAAPAGASGRAGGGMTSGREAELMSTITNLKVRASPCPPPLHTHTPSRFLIVPSRPISDQPHCLPAASAPPGLPRHPWGPSAPALPSICRFCSPSAGPHTQRAPPPRGLSAGGA